jgi:hypothetical protein
MLTNRIKSVDYMVESVDIIIVNDDFIIFRVFLLTFSLIFSFVLIF